MLRWPQPDLPLVVGRARVPAARLVHDRFPNSVLVMDDGFQHLPLKKHVSIVLDEREPFNSRCLPAGPYREPRKNLSRADAIVWTDGIADAFHLQRTAIRFVKPNGDEAIPMRGTILCAIGRPDAFVAAVRAKTEVTGSILLPDHDDLSSGTLFDRLPEGEPIIVTAKDWVKLRDRRDLPESVYIGLEDVSVQPSADFQLWLNKRLDEFKTQ
jgi:tetraacyldisaccharide 4'-kinase